MPKNSSEMIATNQPNSIYHEISMCCEAHGVNMHPLFSFFSHAVRVSWKYLNVFLMLSIEIPLHFDCTFVVCNWLSYRLLWSLFHSLLCSLFRPLNGWEWHIDKILFCRSLSLLFMFPLFRLCCLWIFFMTFSQKKRIQNY